MRLKLTINLSLEMSLSATTSPIPLQSFLNFQLIINNMVCDHIMKFVKRVGELG